MADEYATYVIFFHDRNEYEFAVAAMGGTPETGAFFDGSPFHAAQYFDIPYPFPSGNMDDIDKGVYYNSGYFPGKELNNFAPPNVIMNEVDDEYTVPGYPGSPGFAGTGASRVIRWSGILLYMQGANPDDPGAPTPIAQRRWIMGWENLGLLEGDIATPANSGSREASRTLDGIGYPVRRGNGLSQSNTRRLSDSGVTSRKSWERIYIRPRVSGTGPVGFWRCRNSVTPAAGISLAISAAGELQLFSINSLSTATLQQTGPVLNAFEWYKIDAVFEFSPAPLSAGNAFIFVNGVLTFTFSQTSDGLGAVGNHSESNVGKGNGISGLGTSDAQVEYDLDDWMNAEWPENLGVLSFDGMDWFMGSHIRSGFSESISQTNYTPAGAGQIVNQGINPDVALNAELTSTTSGALLEGTVGLPALGVQDKFGEVAVGPVAAIVGILSRNAAATDGSLGYSVAGGGAVMTVINELASNQFRAVYYRPSGLIEPAEINPFTVRYTKSADANAAFVRALQAIFEYIGIWGPEDCIDPELYPSGRPRTSWLHNCNYPNTPYGLMGPTLETLVFVKAGTYVGNGTQTTVSLPDACHMLFIRAASVDANGVKWFACSLGGQLGTTERVLPNAPVRVYYDSAAGTFKFTVTGSAAQFNQNAITYQYIAFCDPGMRFSCMGAYTVASNQERVHELQNPAFTPEFMFIQRNTRGSVSNLNGIWCKGPGNTGDAGNQLDSPSTVVDFGAFGLGTFTNGTTPTGTELNQHSYAAFRSVEPECGYVMLQICSYTGNGVSPRTINLTPASGRFPVFVLVVPTSGGQPARFRDPLHAGQNSSQFNNPSVQDTNGITGAPAVDQISVGSVLNANGVVYNVFCIPGDLNTAFLNGTYYPPNCENPDPWYNPPLVPPEVAILGEGGLTLNGTVPLTLLKDVSGIYTLVPGKTNDTLYDRQSGQPNIDVEIPDPTAKTGFVGG